MTTLGGNVCIRNGFRLDYPWREAVKSLLPICDEVVICDCDSDDGTRDWIEAWAKSEPKINIVNFPWTDPRGDNQFWPEWLNYARQHLKTEWHIQLDADEVIHEADHELIRMAAENRSTLFCRRLNFWRDPFHLIPEGVCCGTKVLRIAAANAPIPSDYPYEPANETLQRGIESEIRIFHYGFLREREAFFRKAREVQRIWVNSFDPRLEAAERFEGNWSEMPGVTGWENNLNQYAGTHPKVIHPWLAERNYAIS